MRVAFRIVIVLSVGVAGSTAYSADDIGWHSAYDDYFDVHLNAPDYETVRDTLAGHLNDMTIRGVSPNLELLRFDTFVKSARKEHGRRAIRGGKVDDLYENFLDYLQVESQFAKMKLTEALNEAGDVVDRQRHITPDWNSDLDEQIKKVMAKRERIVPSTVLFGVQLYPYRPIAPPDGMTLETADVDERISREPNRTEMVVALPEDSGPVARIDFETIEMQGLIIEASNNGQRFTAVDHITDPHPSGIRPPVIFQNPVAAQFLRLVGTSRTGPAYLREVQFHTLVPAEE